MKTRSGSKKRRKLFGFLDLDEIQDIMHTLGLSEARQPSVQEVVDELQEHPYIQAIYNELMEPERPIPPEECKTMKGYPMGKDMYAPEWRVEFSTDAYYKLMEWNSRRRGLELSGYALLTERPQAELDEEHVFVIDDIMLVCAIEESSGGYTEMSAEQRVQGMMWAREKGRSANCLVWWHIHPINSWSGIDVNTLRQRVHETGLDETVSVLSFVLCPAGIRARWDQANPNIFVDQIPVHVPVIEEAAVAVEELFHALAPGDNGFPFDYQWGRDTPASPTDSFVEYWDDPGWTKHFDDRYYTGDDEFAEIEREISGGQGAIPEWPKIVVTASTYIGYDAEGIVEDPKAQEAEEEEEAE